MTQKRWVKWLVSVGVILAAAVVLASAGGAGSASAAGVRETSRANKYNFVAIPLDVTSSISPFTAAGFASYAGSSVKKIVRFDSISQGFRTHTVGGPLNNFALSVGSAFFIEVDSTANSALSLVGSVPNQGSVTFSLVSGDSPTTCKYNAISIPLDQSSITTASELASAIGGVSKVVLWDPSIQGFRTYTSGGALNNFAVSVGMPFFVCLNSTGPSSWP